MSAASDICVNLREMVTAIETTVSLVGINDTNHGKRVGYIACQLGQELGYNEQDLHDLFELGMLHDMGVSTNQVHESLVLNFDWNGANLHCRIGHQLLKDFEPLAKYAVPILYHHTRWIDLKKKDISIRDAEMANLIYLADRIDVSACKHYGKDILLARKKIIENIKSKSFMFFKPEFVEAFEAVQASESFWIALEDRHILRYVWDMNQGRDETTLSMAQVKQLSEIVAYIVDQKSKFTALHSAKVAELARFIGETCNLNSVQCDKIEVAGLLHDLGKLRTPDEILEKPGALDENERAIMNQHSYETYEILRHISGLEDVAQWAAYHHEGLNGHGYPFHPDEQDLSEEARIIAAADVFQALVQNRPYRRGMPLEKVLSILDEMSIQGKLDKNIIRLIHEHKNQCFEIAAGERASTFLSQKLTESANPSQTSVV